MMEQYPEKTPAQSDGADDKPEVSLGALLREAREHLGLSVADVANQIKFAPRQIEAIEAENYQHLPEEAFLRGFIRSYAKILQLDAQKLLDALPQNKTKTATMELEPASVGVPFPNAHSLLRQNLSLLVAAALLALVAGGFALWNFKSPIKHQETANVEIPVALPSEEHAIPATPVPVEQVTEPTVSDTPKAISKPEIVQPESKPQTKTVAKPETKPVAKPEEKALDMLGLGPAVKKEAKPEARPEIKPEAKPEIKPEAKPVAQQQAIPETETQSGDSTKVSQLRLEFGEESWTEIRDKDDKILSSQVNPAGSELTVYGRAPFTMLIGHGLAARLYHNGKQVDLTPYINKYSEVAHVTLK